MARRPGTTGKKEPPGRLRIVAGNWRSRLLEIADVKGLRPTSERIRETLFNWLMPTIHGTKCLDLFAGTGGLGLEALSRGASECVFVEKSSRAACVLERNVRKLNADGATVLKQDAYDYLAEAGRERFDLVFLDPPFATESVGELCRLIHKGNLLTAGGKVYVEQDRSANEPELPEGWRTWKRGTAGKVRYSLVGPGA